MKKTAILTLILAMALSMLAGCGSTSEPAAEESSAEQTAASDSWENVEPVEITFAHGVPEGEQTNWIINGWMEAVEEKSQGKVTFDYYPAGQLGTQVEMVEQIGLGSIDVLFQESSMWQQYVPEFGILSAPFLIESYDHCANVLYGEAGELVEKSFEENTNCKIIGWCFNGARIIVTTREVKNLEDCAGLIIRSPESQVYIDTFELLGMKPTPIGFSEMYTAIQTGVVEGCDCPAQALYEGGYHNVAPFVCKTRHMYSYNTLSVNQDTWEGLPEAVQNLMIEEWDALKDEMNQMIVTAEDEYYTKFAADGATVNEFEDRDALNDKASAYWQEKTQTLGGYSQQVLDAIIAARP